MFKTSFFGLAIAGFLSLSACATSAWQPSASANPADPAAEPGHLTTATALRRYREASSTKSDSVFDQVQSHEGHDANDTDAHQHHHADPLEDSQ